MQRANLGNGLALSLGYARAEKRLRGPLARAHRVYILLDMNNAMTTYLAAKAETHSTALACVATKKAHPELSMDQVADLSWRIETGKPEPKWLDAEGDQTQASKDRDAGFEKHQDGES